MTEQAKHTQGPRQFAAVEAEAFARDGLCEYVGCGTIEITVARAKHPVGSIRKARSAPATYLQFRLKGKRISRERAEELVLRWNHDPKTVRAAVAKAEA